MNTVLPSHFDARIAVKALTSLLWVVFHICYTDRKQEPVRPWNILDRVANLTMEYHHSAKASCLRYDYLLTELLFRTVLHTPWRRSHERSVSGPLPVCKFCLEECVLYHVTTLQLASAIFSGFILVTRWTFPFFPLFRFAAFNGLPGHVGRQTSEAASLMNVETQLCYQSQILGRLTERCSINLFNVFWWLYFFYFESSVWIIMTRSIVKKCSTFCCEIWSFHGDEDSGRSPLDFDAVQLCGRIPTFRSSMLCEYGGRMSPRNVGILPHNCTASQRPRLECPICLWSE
jgi:hypothetical protein